MSDIYTDVEDAFDLFHRFHDQPYLGTDIRRSIAQTLESLGYRRADDVIAETAAEWSYNISVEPVDFPVRDVESVNDTIEWIAEKITSYAKSV